MGKIKHTKLKNRQNYLNSDSSSSDIFNYYNHSKKRDLLTSKNLDQLIYKGGKYNRIRKNDSINKQNKRTKNNANIRTLDVINKYGSNFINNNSGNQYGGLFKHLRFKQKVKKIRKIIKQLGENEKDINEFIDSYKTQTNTFKRLGDKKAVVIYDTIRSTKEQIRFDYLLKNKLTETDFKTSNLPFDLETIKSKLLASQKSIKKYNKLIKKEKPKFDKFQKKFNNERTQFLKIINKYQELQSFYEEQREIKDKFIDVQDKIKITEDDKKDTERYEKYKEDIEYILSYSNQNINILKKNIGELDTILNKSDDYNTQYENLRSEKYDKLVIEWKTHYSSIYENIITINGNIEKLENTFKQIDNLVEIIQRDLGAIYIALHQTDKINPVLKVKKILEDNLEILNNIKNIIKRIKIAFIQNIPIEDVTMTTTYSEAGFLTIENEMKKLKNSLILDRKFLLNPNKISLSLKTVGGASHIKYDEFRKYNMKQFLDCNYKKLLEYLIEFNDDLEDENSNIYKINNNSEFYDNIKVYFNIALFFIYYYKTRDNILQGKSQDLDINDTEEKIILFFITIIDIYDTTIMNNVSNPDYKNKYFDELPSNLTAHIKTQTSDVSFLKAFISNIETQVDNYFTSKIDEDNIKNPFISDANFKTIKDLYYVYNPHSSNDPEHLGCISTFLGYSSDAEPEAAKYQKKDKCEVNESSFEIKKPAVGAKPKPLSNLHSNYDKSPLIYYFVDNTGGGGGGYKFATIYHNITDNTTNLVDIKTLKHEEFNNIQRKYIDLKIKLTANTTAPQATAIINASNEFILQKYINGDPIFENMFCSDNTDTIFETFINNYLQNIPVAARFITGRIKFLKNYILTDLVNITNGIVLYQNGANQNVNGIIGGNKQFKQIYFPFISILQDNLIPYLLVSVYNNIDYNENPLINCPQTLPDLPKAILKLTQPPLKDSYIILYIVHNDEINNNHRKQEHLQKYLYIWLNSDLNNNDDDTKLQKDSISGFIEFLYKNKGSTKLNEFNLTKFDINEMIKNIDTIDRRKLSGAYTKLYNSYLASKTPINIQSTPTGSTTIVNTGIINEKSSSLVVSEDRYFFDNEKAYVDDNAFDNPNKSAFISTPSKPIVKANEYPDIQKPEDKVKRIVSFNVHRWNTLDDLKNKNDLRTDPEYAIDFIDKTLPNSDVVVFLDYTLYPETSNKANIHTARIQTGGDGGDSVDSGDSVDTYTAIPYIHSGGATITSKDVIVSNSYISSKMKDDLKLSKFFIYNDNIDTSGKPITPVNGFLGKGLYYNDNLTNANIINITDTNDKILFCEYKIKKDTIGLYIVNFTIEKGPLKFKDKILNLIQAIKNNVRTNGILEYVVMGNFNTNPNDDPDAFQQLIDSKMRLINNLSNITYIDNKTFDLCYVSEDFDSKFIILNETKPEGIVVKSNVSDHYPIYIDIMERADALTLAAVQTANNDIDAAKAKVAAAQAKIAAAQAKIDAAKAKLSAASSTKEISSAKKDLSVAEKDLEDAEKELADAEKELKDAEAKANTLKLTLPVDPSAAIPISADAFQDKADKEEEEEALKSKAGRLLSTFMDVAEKANAVETIATNKEAILNNIKEIINIIKNELNPENYNNITKNINVLSQNIIQLKLIEPKLTPDKVVIKDYKKEIKEFDFISDEAKKQASAINLGSETKDLAKLIKSHPEIGKILPSATDNITDSEISQLIAVFSNFKDKPNISEDIKKILPKLQNDNNSKKLIEFLNKTIKDVVKICAYVKNIKIHTDNSKELQKYLEDYDCINKVKDDKEKQYQKKKYSRTY